TTGRTGTLEFIGTEQLDSLYISDDLPVHWLSAEQSNSSLLVGDVAMIKLIRHIFPGIHPEVNNDGITLADEDLAKMEVAMRARNQRMA
ncbi:hypothetical protein ACC772_38545, partial [Rhizobium ruizarguesonis]